MFQDMTGMGEEQAVPAIEKKPSSKAGGKTVRRGKRDWFFTNTFDCLELIFEIEVAGMRAPYVTRIDRSLQLFETERINNYYLPIYSSIMRAIMLDVIDVKHLFRTIISHGNKNKGSEMTILFWWNNYYYEYRSLVDCFPIYRCGKDGSWKWPVASPSIMFVCMSTSFAMTKQTGCR